MSDLTKRQRQIFDYIQKCQQSDGMTPSLREIAAHFGSSNASTIAQHVNALVKKGVLSSEPKQARSLRVVSLFQSLRKRVVDIPVFGSIPAGFAEERKQEAKGCITIDVGSVGLKTTARTFAVQVRGESMIGKNICDGDLVILEHGVEPKTGDVVAALIDNESTLKTFVSERGRAYLRAENPRFPNLIPLGELLIQGVMMALVRKRK